MNDEQRLDKIWEDMYTGDGKENPSVTARISVQEEKMLGVEKKIEWANRFAVSTLISVLIGLVAAIWDIAHK